MRLALVCMLPAAIMCGACQQPTARLNAPPHGVAQRTSDMRDTFEHMLDNALLEDMTVTDVHFLPHRSILSDLGQQRLCRLANLLDIYGGTVRFDTGVTDAQLVDERVDVIVAFLAEQGVDASRELLRQDLPGGRGMDAQQAILIKASEGTYKPKKKAEKSTF